MNNSLNDISIIEFKDLIEYEINRLDSIINSIHSQIIPVKFYLYASILSVLIFLSQFINEINSKMEKDNIITLLLLTITAIAFSLIVFLPILSSLISMFLRLFKDKTLLIPVIKNVPYQEVLNKNIRDRELFRSEILIPKIKILFILHTFFGILILSPYYLDNITIIKWDKAFYWVAYFLITDIIIFIGLFVGIKTLYEVIFDFKNLIRNIISTDLSTKSGKQKLVAIFIIIFTFLWIMFYPFFWYYLTFEFLKINYGNFVSIININLFLVLLIFFISLVAITSLADLIGKNYKVKILLLKQVKYREIRRVLYESKEPNIKFLMEEFIP